MIHSFLLIGQSNMAGRGIIADAEHIDTEHIYVLRNGRWVGMSRPVNPDRQFSGVSLGESFAQLYASEYGVDVGLISCADGGTSLDQWKKGSILYDNAVYQAKIAQRTSSIAGILWHQGEADCPPELNATYEERFLKFVSDIRADLGLENVPFIAGGLGDFLEKCNLDENLQYRQKINRAIKNASSKGHLIGFAPADGLTSNDDMLHFNSKSLYEFGIRYFEEYKKLVPMINIASTSNVDEKRTEMELL